MEDQNRKLFYTKTRLPIVRRRPNPAAMVFEEAARLSYQLRQLWPQASALTPKVPAPLWLSHQNAQTHRLLVQQARPHLSYDQKNEFRCSTKPKGADHSLEKRGKRLDFNIN